jgi:HSP20 family protein
MTTLERWLPFKFRRRKAEDKNAEVTETEALTPFESFFGAPMSQFMRSFREPFFKDAFARLDDFDQWFGDFSPTKFKPTVDVVDEEGAIRVTAELPGMSKDDVEISVDNDMLTIRGEKRNEEESKENGAFRTERYYGYVQRTVPLPTNVAAEKAKASFDKGVLTVRLPKNPEALPSEKKIPIK